MRCASLLWQSAKIQWMEVTADHFGKADVLVSNAGVGPVWSCGYKLRDFERELVCP